MTSKDDISCLPSLDSFFLNSSNKEMKIHNTDEASSIFVNNKQESEFLLSNKIVIPLIFRFD
jgi:hypothetical protein